MSKIVSAQEAASYVKDGAVLAVNGMLWVGGCRDFNRELGKRFLETGSPRDLTLFSSCGIGSSTASSGVEPELANRLAHPGMVKKIITSHIQSYTGFFDAIRNNQIEAYLIPQGTISQMFHTAARRVPGIMTRIGLKTHVDPRYQAGALNECSKDKLAEVVTVDGEELLFYRNIYPDVCIIRGTTADAEGNISMEHECVVYDPLATAMATHNNGGIVIVEVKRITSNHTHPQMVKIPGSFVDYIYVDPEQTQTAAEKYNPYYSGELRAPEENCGDFSAVDGNDRPKGVKVITRRAALEVKKGSIINLGIGMPSQVGMDAVSMGLVGMDDIKFTVELGSFGGVPAGSASFGASLNTDAIYNQAEMFEFYEGGGLDATFVGALEFDRYGNANVVQSGSKQVGVGGFNYVTAYAKTVVFCSKFLSKSDYEEAEDTLKPITAGFQKVKEHVEYISFNGEIASAQKQNVLYITERCVFRLTDGELEIIEVSPYVDLQKDVLDLLPFPVKVSKELKTMPAICFE